MPLAFKRTHVETDTYTGTAYIGNFVHPETFMDLGRGDVFAIPAEDLRGTWLQPVQAIDPDTGIQQLATALAGVVESGHTFVFGTEIAPCFAPIPLN